MITSINRDCHHYHCISGKAKQTMTSKQANNDKIKCKADVGYVVDVSGSVEKHWADEKNFIKRLAKRINISPDEGHAAVTIFSSKNKKHPDAELKIKFSDHTTLKGFKKAVNALPFWARGTRINKGLQVAHKEMFQESNGMRPNVSKTLVLITDGTQSRVDYPKLANLFRKAKIRVVVVGIGKVNKVDLLKLVDIASDLHIVKHFDALRKSSFIKSISQCTGMLYYTI